MFGRFIGKVLATPARLASSVGRGLDYCGGLDVFDLEGGADDLAQDIEDEIAYILGDDD